MAEYAAVMKKDLNEVFRSNAAKMFDDIIKRTPPQSGKILTGMISASRAGAGWRYHDPETSNLASKKLGENAVERDFRRLFYPVTQWTKVGKVGKRGSVFLHGDENGVAHVVAPDLYEPAPTVAWMKAVHGRHRSARGGVDWATRGEKKGDHLFEVKKYPVSERVFKAGLASAKKAVGKARGGWVAVFQSLGKKLPAAWVSNHKDQGSGFAKFTDTTIHIEQTNRSPWVARRDGEILVANAIAARERSMLNQMRHALKQGFGGRYDLKNISKL